MFICLMVGSEKFVRSMAGTPGHSVSTRGCGRMSGSRRTQQISGFLEAAYRAGEQW